MDFAVIINESQILALFVGIGFHHRHPYAKPRFKNGAVNLTFGILPFYPCYSFEPYCRNSLTTKFVRTVNNPLSRETMLIALALSKII
jgi:hypothetical protein